MAATNVPVPVSGKIESLSISNQLNSYFVFTSTYSSESGDVDYAAQFSSDLQTWVATGILLDVVDNGNGTLTERWRQARPINSTNRLFARFRAQFK